MAVLIHAQNTADAEQIASALQLAGYAAAVEAHPNAAEGVRGVVERTVTTDAPAQGLSELLGDLGIDQAETRIEVSDPLSGTAASVDPDS